MNKRIPVLLVLVLAAAVAGGLWWQGRASGTSGALTCYGNVDIREVNVAFRVAGKVASVRKDEGDAVQAGEVLATLDDEPFRKEADEARAQVDSLQARLNLLEAGYRPEEVAQARAAAREREVTAQNAERVFHRQQELSASKAISPQELDDAQARYNEAEARLKSAREQLTLLESGYRVEERNQARADLERARAQVASADLRVSDAVLRAPSDGVVITRALEPGAFAAAGTTVLTVSLKQPVWVRAYVGEPELGRLHPGLKTEIFTDARPQQPYHGVVGYISPRAEFTPKNVETTDLRTTLVYRFRVVVSDADEGLRQGMPVTVKLVPETVAGAPAH